MKLPKALLSCVVLASLLAPQVSSALDITNNGVDTFIQVVREGHYRRFAICKASEMPDSCRPLGDRPWYTVKMLNHQYKVELAQAVGSTVAAAGVAILACLSGAAIYGGISYFGASAALAGTAGNVIGVTVTAGAGAGGGALATLASWGPVEQFKQQWLLRDDVINDHDVILTGKTDKDIEAIATRLDLVLRNIE